MKKRERILLTSFLLLAFWGFSGAYLSLGSQAKDISNEHPVIAELVRPPSDTPVSYNQALSLLTMPDDTTASIISLIQNAKKSVDLTIYTLSDKKIQSALVSAKNRGVAVRVLLNAGWEGVPTKKNQTTFDSLSKQGVSVKWSPDYFALMHQKTLIVDGTKALIMTFNLDRAYYKTGRDFGILNSDPTDISAIIASFNSDWNGDNKVASDGKDLVWSPDSRLILVSLIESAKNSLDIYSLEMDEDIIEDALSDASRRGVEVKVLMSMQTSWLTAFRALTASGVEIRTFPEKAPLFIHAKVIIADESRAFVGSENFSANSLDNNRELGIIFTKADIISSIMKTFKSDWASATVFR
ncbi:MAG: hypothetical protein KBC17_01060 [Candidatus Pacebacteria bacterium]|nr:hypothetical protein [Candidatus Paceibacterota bacterium]